MKIVISGNNSKYSVEAVSKLKQMYQNWFTILDIPIKIEQVSLDNNVVINTEKNFAFIKKEAGVHRLIAKGDAGTRVTAFVLVTVDDIGDFNTQVRSYIYTPYTWVKDYIQKKEYKSVNRFMEGKYITKRGLVEENK